MAPFDECCVLIPSATLEDFPTNASDFDARSLLAAWTVLWHPTLLAQSEQLPTWYRADAPPDADGPRIVAVPPMCQDQLPRGYESKYRKNPDCRWITGETRAELLSELQIDSPADLSTDERTIGVADFYAAGFVALQIQIMTRRLRYTSNLDEIHLQTRLVAAAKGLIERDAEAAAEAMHDVFDCLAEERDHYFSSDPHLIDLTLLTPGTLDSFLQHQLPALIEGGRKVESGQAESGQQAEGEFDEEQEGSVRPVPGNVLIDHTVATELAAGDARYDDFRNALADGKLGWAGGDPDPATCMDAMTLAQAIDAVNDAHALATKAIGAAPKVFSRFAGATPADLTPAIVRLGFAGMIPLDFSRGSGFGDEAKVIRQGGGAEIEALTAKPIDATSDASFLDFGARVGEAIDSGEIATALLVHWPGKQCDSFADLKRAASWSLALGRFWKLHDYFSEGEHPYHHGSAKSVSPEASAILSQQVEQNEINPLSRPAAEFQKQVHAESHQRVLGMIALAKGQAASSGDGDPPSLESQLAEAHGATLAPANPSAKLCVNPHGRGGREQVLVSGFAPPADKQIYAASQKDSKQTEISIDVPAYGFAVAEGSQTESKRGSLLGRLFSGPKPIAQGHRLANKFMEVVISEQTGGVQGIYSGQLRGNRFSLRLVAVSSQFEGDQPADDSSQMVADKVKVIAATEATGVIEATGRITDSKAKTLASFSLSYTLMRGSRVLQVSGWLKPAVPLKGDPWREYLAARAAVSSEAAIVRCLVRDKVHRSRSRRLVSPLGVVIDEAERQTLLTAGGRPYHRKLKDRFVDTLLAVAGEQNEEFQLNYGIDVKHPVAAAQSLLTPPLQVGIEKNASLPTHGWIVHVSPAETLANQIQLRRRDDGLLAAVVRVIQTRSRGAKVALRFCRDVQFACILDGTADDPWNLPLPNPDAQEKEDGQRAGVKYESDVIQFPVDSHQVTDLLVVFADPDTGQ